MKKLRIALIILMIILGTLFFMSQTYATSIQLNIQEPRPFNDDDGDGTSGNDKYTITRGTGAGLEVHHTIFKIGEKISNNLTYSRNLYCLRAGLGFGDSESVTNINNVQDVTYTDTYNLKTQASNVISYYTNNFTYNIDNSYMQTINGTTTTFTPYNAILWLVDNMFLAVDDDQGTAATTDDYVAADYYALLMEKAGITNTVANPALLTYDDIEVAQQMALWHFANYDTNGADNSLSLRVDNTTTQTRLANIMTIDALQLEYFSTGHYDRASQVTDLYEYFVNQAKINANQYGTTDPRDTTRTIPTIGFARTSPRITSSGGFSIIGPFQIDINTGTNVEYSIDTLEMVDANSTLIPASDNGTPIYNLVSTPASLTPAYNSLEEAVGQGQFYIKIADILAGAYDLSTVTLNLGYSYYYYNTKATLWLATTADQPVVEIEKEKVEGNDDDTITTSQIQGQFNLNLRKVDENGNLLTGAEFRVEKVDRSTVTLTNNNDGTFNTGNIPITSNGEQFVYDITETTTPVGYDGLTSSVRIRITTGLDATGRNYVITGATLVDATGAVITINGVTIAFTGTSLTLTVENEPEFDLALRKFITSVNGINLTGTLSREPQIDTTNLKNRTATTATYTHPKTAMSLKRGDKIVYTIRVYNEGNADGMATEITDYLPEGLNLATGSTINTRYGIQQNGRTLTSTYLANTVIKAYDSTVTGENAAIWQQSTSGTDGLYYADIQVECVIADTAADDTVLRNIAEITSAEDSDGNAKNLPGDDVDSTPDNVDTGNYTPPTDNSSYQEDDDDYEQVKVTPETLDLALRKFITSVNGTELTGTSSRKPQIDTTDLINGVSTTATYTHSKTPLYLKRGDKIVYTIRVYNEGNSDGIASEITDYLPTGLDLATGSTINTMYGIQKSGSRITSTYLGNTIIKAYNSAVTGQNATIWQQSTNGTDGLYYADIQVECVILDTVADGTILRNIAEITEAKDAYGNPKNNVGDDIDSTPDNVDTGSYTPPTDNSSYQEDDDDYERVVVESDQVFDLSLRKFITNINGTNLTGTDSRVPEIDTSGMQLGATTATYTHSKEPIIVKQGDIVTYKIRVYNEGEIDGYAEQITDYIPEGLGYLLNYKTNTDNGWRTKATTPPAKTISLVGTDGLYKKISDVKNLSTSDFYNTTSLDEVSIVVGKAGIYTEKLEDDAIDHETLIKAYDPEIGAADINAGENWQKSTNGTDGLYYQEVEITCIVLAENTYEDLLRNIAEITGDLAVDEDNVTVVVSDIDSTPENVDTDHYTPPTDNSSYQEDDDDYELLELKYFDLALRKFITGVNDEGIETRIPEVVVDADGNITYKHDKTPVYVANSDFVTYTIRVYNEGSVDGYAEVVADDIPVGVKFVQTSILNQEYGWKMYDADGNETINAEDAVTIATTYLSEASGEARKANADAENPNLLKGYSPTSPITSENPDYLDVKVIFEVVEAKMSATDTSRIITNYAQIAEDKAVDEDGDKIDIDDEDSTPGTWIEGEDDQDVEHIYVKCFDLSLLKWVTKTIVTVDGKTTTTETGFNPNQGLTDQTGEGIRDNSENEPIAAVVIDKKKLSSTTVKFAYTIKVTNEGEIDGQVREITDYIPEGLEFVAEDNPLWTKVGDDKITTNALDGLTLKAPIRDAQGNITTPGESATVEVIFTWINNKDNLGLKVNKAEISEDYNEKGSEDVDSNPNDIVTENYDKEQQDDDDFAQVILSLKTGGEQHYILLGATVIIILLGGAVLIKKYVL